MKPALVQNPVRGGNLSVALIRGMNNEIRKNKPIAGRGVRINYTMGGAIISVIDTVGGGGGGGGSGLPEVDVGCWCLKSVEDTDLGLYYTGFGNQYVMVGDKLTTYNFETTLEDLSPKAFPDEDEMQGNWWDDNNAGDDVEESADGTKTKTGSMFVAIRINATGTTDSESYPHLEGYPTVSELISAQGDFSWHTIPIYKMDVVKTYKEESDGTVSETMSFGISCDFRKGIFAQQVEVFE